MSEAGASAYDLPGAVLFICNLNRVRSPMAAALARRRVGDRVFVDSCGLQDAEEADPFAVTVMRELGLDLSAHAPKTLAAMQDGSFDLVICLTPEAHARATVLSRGRAVEVRAWPIADPTMAEGSRDERLAQYRRVRDDLDLRLTRLFAGASPVGR